MSSKEYGRSLSATPPVLVWRRAVLPLLVASIGLAACSRSIRDDAARVAESGATTARQMVQLYQSLQHETADTYELNVFREAFLTQRAYDDAVERARQANQPPPAPPTFEMTALDVQLSLEYQKTYDALAARARMARAMQQTYDGFAHLASYNAAAEVERSVEGLSKAVSGAVALALPDPTGVAASAAQSLLKEVAARLADLKQNSSLRSASTQIVPIVTGLKAAFDAEKPLLGGDSDVRDSQGVSRKVSGIAGRRAAAYKAVARELVLSDSVISAEMITRVLAPYQLRWPDPQRPFSDAAVKAGIIKMIEARAYPLAQLSVDASEGLSRSLGRLLTLHRQLMVGQPLSLDDALQDSATVQVLLDRLKSDGVPVETIADLLKTLR
jgi:hypothetical protein